MSTRHARLTDFLQEHDGFQFFQVLGRRLLVEVHQHARALLSLELVLRARRDTSTALISQCPDSMKLSWRDWTIPILFGVIESKKPESFSRFVAEGETNLELQALYK